MKLLKMVSNWFALFLATGSRIAQRSFREINIQIGGFDDAMAAPVDS